VAFSTALPNLLCSRGNPLKVTFFGVRGSTPCPTGPNARYGGNTSCVALNIPGEDPIVFDLGTGLQSWGRHQPLDGTFNATALVTHFHFDHVQGLPFLAAADRPGAKFAVYGPGESGSTVKDLFTGFVRPPYFPVGIDQLRGTYGLHDVIDADFTLGESGDVKVMVRPVPHVGLTVGYRVDWNGKSVTYISDHQAPEGLDSIAPEVLELCDGVDLLIHDSQYTNVDWETKSHWGHCTVDYALDVAIASKAKTLCLFHHDPSRTDTEIDKLTASLKERAKANQVDVFAAAEGLTIEVGRPVGPQIAKAVSVGPMFSSNC
jgi:phosphoribosyl 1,2-cyclic phosphodiesterase